MADPCEKCEAAFFEVDTEWAQLYAASVREKDDLREALHEVCRDLWARFDFDAYALPVVQQALGREHVRECRRVLREARATVEAEPR